jgi:uncharacterized membrane protein
LAFFLFLGGPFLALDSFSAETAGDKATMAAAAPVSDASAAKPGQSAEQPAKTTAPGKGGVQILKWRPFLAPFHNVVLHFPIGFLTAAFLLEVFRWRHPSDELRRGALMLLWFSLLSGVVAAVFGLMRAEGNSYDPALLSSHRAFGFAVLGFTLSSIILQILSASKNTMPWIASYRVVLLATLALLTLAGHFGGNLTHGSRYLTENAPEFIRRLLDENAPAAASVQAMEARAEFYKNKVEPIFSAKCYSCHGPEKKKGGYRLDAPEIALKGGESEEVAIKPGDPIGSHLVRLVLLPESDDDVMPPSGRTRLTPEELGNIIEWIREGAVFPVETQKTAALPEG